MSIQMETVPADTHIAAPASEPVRVGLVLREDDLRRHGRRLASLTRAVADARIDHVAVGDHVSFGGGGGADGLVQATALLASHPTLEVQTAVYLLALRHP